MRKRRRHNKNKKQASTKQNKIKQSIAYQANNNNSSTDDDADDDDDEDVVAGLLLRLGTGDNLLLLLQHIRNAFGPFFGFGQREMAAWTNFHFHWTSHKISHALFGSNKNAACALHVVAVLHLFILIY